MLNTKVAPSWEAGRGPGVLCTYYYYWCMHVCPAVGSGLPETGQRFANLKPNTFGARKPCWKSIDAKARSAGKNSRRTVLHCWCLRSRHMSDLGKHKNTRRRCIFSALKNPSILWRRGGGASSTVLFRLCFVIASESSSIIILDRPTTAGCHYAKHGASR